MALDCILSFAPTIVEYTIGPLIRHVGYALNYKRKVEELKDRVAKLSGARDNLQHTADDSLRKGEVIQKNVEKWLTDVDKAIEEAEEMIKGEEEATEGCFVGLCPNFKTRYQLGKKAAKEALAIEGLENQGKFDRISYRAAPQQIVSSSINVFEGLPSRASILNEVMDALTDPNVNMIGVYGMGGAGKTTLVKEIHKQAIEGKLFSVVVMAVVSEKPELEKVQGKIADVLGLKLDEETVDGRAIRLHQRLMQENKVLIILDNLWGKIELEAVGIPSPNHQKGCKLLLTSRSRDVLSTEMGTQKDFRLEVLPEEESWSLFERMVGGIKNPKIHSVAVEVAKKCAGLPLLLVTVASALKNKELEVWKDAFKRLCTFHDEELQTKVYSALELSYDHLVGEEVKSFLLLCGLFSYPNILILDLLKYGMGLGLFKHINTVEDARNRVHKLIGDLKASCLLVDSEINGCVKIHDVVRDVAAAIASRTQLVFKVAGVQLKEWPNTAIKNCTRIFLYRCDISEVPLRLQCTEVELFQLSTEDDSLTIPDCFFEGISKLKVLDFTGLCFSSLPLSVGSLTGLTTLCLDSCTLHDICVIGQLNNLEVLSLMDSEIIELPGELAQLSRLKLLDLSNCTKLEVIPTNVLSMLTQLEELYMGNSFAQWGAKRLDNGSNADLSELEHLPQLTNLEIHVPDGEKLPKGFFTRRLERYKIFIGDEWDWDGDYETSRTLKLKLRSSIHKTHGVKMFLKETEELFLDEVNGIKSVLNDLVGEGLPHLKYLHVQNAPQIRYIIDSESWFPSDAFPVLESLFLHNLMGLEKIFHGQLAAEIFSSLSILTVRSCHRLRNLFSFSMVRCLQRLCRLEVIDCKKMEEIFTHETEDGDKNEVAEFTRLHTLKLQLPQLRSCSRGKVPSISQIRKKNLAVDAKSEEVSERETETLMPLFNGMIVFPSLEEVELTSIQVEKIWINQLINLSTSLQKLKSLIVGDCGNLKFLFSPFMVRHLAQLRRLDVYDCKSMEQIVDAEVSGEGEIMGNLLFPRLEFLNLSGLPKLICFCSSNLIEWPLLKELWIKSCPQLNKFILQSIREDLATNPNSGNTNAILFDEKVALPKLEKLQIIDMDSLKMIWHNELHKESFCRLKSLTVKHCEKLRKMFPSNIMLTRFQNLEQLHVEGCKSLEEVFDLQVLMEIKGTHAEMVSQLTSMYLRNLPNLKHIWNENPQGILSFKNLCTVHVWECPSLQSIFPASVAKILLRLEDLNIDSCGVEEIIAKEEGGKEEALGPRFIFPKLNSVVLWKLLELERFYPGRHTAEWPALKILHVYKCDKMKIFSFESQRSLEPREEDTPEIHVSQPLFSFQEVVPSLEDLSLNKEDVTMIRESQLPADFFDKVKALELKCFHDVSAVFPFDFLHRFCHMENLVVGCSNFEELFAYEELAGKEEHKRALAPIRQLRLDFLSDLKHIWKEDSQPAQVLPNLKALEVWFCDSLIILAPSSASFQSLTTLEVKNCHGLVSLFASSTAKTLVQLANMRISECNTVTEIVASEKGVTEQEIVFRRLVSLELGCLPNLTSFSSEHHSFKFPSLKRVIVSQCPKMEFFSGGIPSTPKLVKVKLAAEDYKGHWNGNLNATIKQLFADNYVTP